jgi:DNA-binding PadR family transcriptional regulator
MVAAIIMNEQEQHMYCRKRHAYEHRHRRHGFGRGGFGRGRGRAGRGDIRAAILALLAEQPMHGYQIIREISERSQGAWEPSPGSVYPTLQQLEDEGLVEADRPEGRRTYNLTAEGRTQAEAREGAAPWELAAHGEEGAFFALRGLTFSLLGAVKQVAEVGDEAQLDRAQEILREARRQLYQLLAEDPGSPAA